MRIDVRKWGLTALGFLVFASCNNSPVSSTTISTSSRETDATSADEALLQKIGVPGLLTFEKGFIHVPKDDWKWTFISPNRTISPHSCRSLEQKSDA